MNKEDMYQGDMNDLKDIWAQQRKHPIRKFLEKLF